MSEIVLVSEAIKGQSAVGVPRYCVFDDGQISISPIRLEDDYVRVMHISISGENDVECLVENLVDGSMQGIPSTHLLSCWVDLNAQIRIRLLNNTSRLISGDAWVIEDFQMNKDGWRLDLAQVLLTSPFSKASWRKHMLSLVNEGVA